MALDLGANLLCCETGVSQSDSLCKAIRDPTIVNDSRVLTNLLDAESRYMPSSYFKCVQNEIKLPMRRILSYWMVEVCEEQRCQDDVFPLAMNLLDRFLSVTTVRKTHLQLVGAVCLFVSSKLRESRALSAEALVRCADHSISAVDIVEWELFLLHSLHWEVNAVTSHDLLQPLLDRLQLPASLEGSTMAEVGRQAQTFVVMCCTEFQFSMQAPSMVAAASLLAAAQGLFPQRGNTTVTLLCHQLQRITAVETEVLRGCLDQLEAMLADFTAEQQQCGSAAPPASGLQAPLPDSHRCATGAVLTPPLTSLTSEAACAADGYVLTSGGCPPAPPGRDSRLLW